MQGASGSEQDTSLSLWKCWVRGRPGRRMSTAPADLTQHAGADPPRPTQQDARPADTQGREGAWASPSEGLPWTVRSAHLEMLLPHERLG